MSRTMHLCVFGWETIVCIDDPAPIAFVASAKTS